jgi:hypothetical protein
MRAPHSILRLTDLRWFNQLEQTRSASQTSDAKQQIGSTSYKWSRPFAETPVFA